MTLFQKNGVLKKTPLEVALSWSVKIDGCRLKIVFRTLQLAQKGRKNYLSCAVMVCQT